MPSTSKRAEGMPSTSKNASAATAMMQDEVAVMEQRLQQLRTTMSAERERRTAAQKANPSGTQWRSARTDVPTGKYANHALANKPPPQKRRDRAGGEASAMGRTGNRFGLVHGEGVDSAGAASGHVMPGRDTTAAGNGVAALRASAGTSTVFTHEVDEAAGRTRPAGEWQPSFSLPDESVEYDLLMAPEEPAGSASSGGVGSLLHGTFDEEAERAAFQAAVSQWRGGGGGVQAQAQAGGGGGGGGGGGSLLHGAFDEEAEKAAFQAAVAEWRGEPPPEPRARAQPAPRRAPAASSLTLAQKVGAINAELGLPEQPVADAIAQANATVGLQPRGTLLEQVGRLLLELGLQPEAGLATGTAEPAVQPRAAMAVQTSTGRPNYFALLQEQKRKDGLL